MSAPTSDGERCICGRGPGGAHDDCPEHGPHLSDPKEWCDLCQRREGRAELVAAIRAIDASATPYGGEDGFVAHYVIPSGPLHRALGLIVGDPR